MIDITTVLCMVKKLDTMWAIKTYNRINGFYISLMYPNLNSLKVIHTRNLGFLEIL